MKLEILISKKRREAFLELNKMASIEQLKAKRNKEAKRYIKVINVTNVKESIKKDIRNIRAAKLRSKLGFIKSKPDVPKIKKGTGTFLKTMGKIAAGLGDGVKMLGNPDTHKKEARRGRT